MVEFSDEAKQDLTEARALYPSRRLELIDYADREMIVFAPTRAQALALSRVGMSRTVEDVQRLSDFLDLIEALVVEDDDKRWLNAEVLSGRLDFGAEGEVTDTPVEGAAPTVLGLLGAIAAVFAVEGDNRADRRRNAKARRVQ